MRVRENNKDTERLCAAFRENNGERVEAKLFGLNDAIDLLIKNKVRKTSYIWMVDFENDGSFRSSTTFEKDSRPSVLIGKLKVKQFLYLMKDFKKKKLDLFEDNVRLDMRNSELSRELIGTLTKYPADFYIYHNGLTISCSLIEPDGDVSYRIHNPSVINGCQSLNAILRGCKDGYVKNKHLKEATILCRIFALNSQKKVEAVCQSTNTQRKINTWDLRANDPIQKLLELILREKNITYYRKIRNIKKNEILITDLAQWIYSCKFEKPADAKNQKSQLFDIREEEDSIYWGKIFRESLLEIDELENICRIGLFVRDKIGNVKGKGNKDKKKFLRYSNFHIMAALYLITRNCGIQAALSDKAYEFAISETNKIVRERVNDDSDKYTFNFLFSKDKNTWLSLKQKIINWKPNG